MSLQITPYVKRPGVGEKGVAMQVRSNYFEITQLPDTIIYHYDVTITPDVPPPVNRRVYEQFQTQYRDSDLGGVRPVYDGRKNIFAPVAFPFESRTFKMLLTEESRARRQPNEFTIKVKKAATINLEELHRFLTGRSALTNNCLTAIMSLDVLIRHQPAMLYATIGRAFYTPQGKQLLNGPLEAWRGYYQSVRATAGKMMINVDITASAFYQSGSLLEMAVKILNKRSPDDLRGTAASMNWQKVERQIKGLRITVTHRERTKREFKIFNLTKTAAKDTRFTLSSPPGAAGAGGEAQPGGETDIVSYFKSTYNITLSYPMLPCVSAGKNLLLPMELCSVVSGQRYMKKLDERQTADMIKFTTQTPTVRLNTIKNGLQILNYHNNEFMRDFGMKVSAQMATVRARALPVPKIMFSSLARENAITPAEGAWNLKNKKLVRTGTLGSWGVVVFASSHDCPKEQINAFLRELIVTCIELGVKIPNKSPPIIYTNPHGDLESSLKAAWVQTGNAVKSQPQLLMCMLPNTGTPLYAEIKRITDTILGVCSQCLQLSNTRNPKKQYCANVCLKINVKLGGMNSHLPDAMMPFIISKPTLVLGGDVSHPQPGDTTRPSIAALVGSMDNKAARYAATIRVQTARTETIADLSGMIVDLLKTFYQTCSEKPGRILFYRDGVSEGQFAEVLKTEIAALRAACLRLEDGYKPKITFVVVQKRHHTRFFPLDPRQADKLGNCRPGTVIDTEVVHPFEFDFYLQSHAAILGTARPAHYYVLQDDNRFTPDELQGLTFNLCHLYARCTRSVSVVPPAYYAHIVAARARFHKRGETFSDTTSVSSTSSTTSSEEQYMGVKPELMKVMWFM
ncbi:hypothetical protein KVV02_008026 [Mortierella alpina]|uniref:Piwi-domain-containing protein n=1 Tax=Mortierella alpina TaxID=64518 RepID=A0A9P8D111_MORAP|nr:hypothetical protein KVV02_008026 [Mortierella alpina]